MTRKKVKTPQRLNRSREERAKAREAREAMSTTGQQSTTAQDDHEDETVNPGEQTHSTQSSSNRK